LRSLSILGSTGSIGCSTLDVVYLHPEKFNIYALSSFSNINLLASQVLKFKPTVIAVKDAEAADKISKLLKNEFIPRIVYGIDGYKHIASASEVTDVVAAISGAAGLIPTMEAVISGKRILLANKEAMVMAGPQIMTSCQKFKAQIIPVDSEHNAIFQILNSNPNQAEIKKIILTASGGPFREYDEAKLANVTLDDALNHPNWVMGKKITIDSATMMNKGLEVIEAAYLFDLSAEMIDVLIHPQSIVHSLVEYIDGSLIGQLGFPDMKVPISYALGFPNRIKSGVDGINLSMSSNLSFEKVNHKIFPCLRLAYQALAGGQACKIILNAANEIAVDAFINKQISFIDIANLIDSAIQSIPEVQVSNLDEIMALDNEVRIKSKSLVKNIHLN